MALKVDLCVDFHVEIGFLHLELTSRVCNLCVGRILRVHPCLLAFRFLANTTGLSAVTSRPSKFMQSWCEHIRISVFQPFDLNGTRLGV